jgi:hypothetical protein
MPFEVTRQFIRNSSRLLMGSMIPLGLGLAADYYIIARLVFEDTARSWLALAPLALFGALAFFWFVFPRSRRLQEWLDRHPDGGRDHSVF